MTMRKIMKRAHELARKMTGHYIARLSLALRQIWAAVKKGAKAMENLKNMSIEELESLKKAIVAELHSREEKPELVLYTHACKGSSTYHLNKYKHWAKLVKSVDVTKTNGYAFAGEFLNVNAEHKIPAGSIVVEVCDCSITAYIAGKEFEEIGHANTRSMSSLIEKVAGYVE
jgi:hypothetical protein